MNRRDFRLLVFDWDGTLMDSIGTIVDCTLASFEGLGEVERPAPDAIRECIGLGLVETMQRHFPDWDEELSARLIDNYRRLWRSDYKDRASSTRRASAASSTPRARSTSRRRSRRRACCSTSSTSSASGPRTR